ncbi:hypothetical protein Celaphus_00002866 [Cervus elaphus hippelaphus]|uniref:Uncharacterized protein n=1 Tax=Cervus elaphus hippelaphus TaxID=46360 RepID=A0A212D2U4_CEREH|nr:hypothetical protein Celaphus_00002866 [Cervus elaphus hippelaphus]
MAMCRHQGPAVTIKAMSLNCRGPPVGAHVAPTFVLATPISGPALMWTPQSVSREMELPTVLVMPTVSRETSPGEVLLHIEALPEGEALSPLGAEHRVSESFRRLPRTHTSCLCVEELGAPFKGAATQRAVLGAQASHVGPGLLGADVLQGDLEGATSLSSVLLRRPSQGALQGMAYRQPIIYNTNDAQES